MKPNDMKEIDRLQGDVRQLKSDVSEGIGLHTAHAVDEIGTNLEDMGRSEEARRNLEDLFASESIHVPAVLRFSEGRCRTWTGRADFF